MSGFVINPFAFGAPLPAGDFPTVIARTEASNGSAVGVIEPSISSSREEGDKLIAVVSATWSEPFVSESGWTRIAFNTGFFAFEKTSAGTETSVTIRTSATTGRVAAQAYVIRGGHADAPEISFQSNPVSDEIAVSPLLEPSWGSADTLWIAGNAATQASAEGSAPSGFGDLLATYAALSTSNLRRQIRTATRELAASSLTPGSWVDTTGSLQQGFTIAVRPA